MVKKQPDFLATIAQQTIKKSKDSGMVRIRFIVNCKGQPGRFRMISAGYDYKEKQLDKAITDQLMSITKGLSGLEELDKESKGLLPIPNFQNC